MIKTLTCIVLLYSCGVNIQDTFTYDFSNPLEVTDLPKELDEISGLYWEKPHELWTINDEEGILYKFNTKLKGIVEKVKFKKHGDFEGITKVKKTFYVLKSNGTILTIKNGKRSDKNDEELFKSGYEFEGLCYLKSKNSLLLACKRHKKASKNEFIWIFEYNLITKKIEKEPFLKISKKKTGQSFKPSGIAIHPDSSIYITSGFSNQLIRVDPTSKDVKMVRLKKKKFPQIEGICFNSDGDLYLSTEISFLPKAKLYKFNEYE